MANMLEGRACVFVEHIMFLADWHSSRLGHLAVMVSRGRQVPNSKIIDCKQLHAQSSCAPALGNTLEIVNEVD